MLRLPFIDPQGSQPRRMRAAALALSLCLLLTARADFYVAPTGADSNEGTKAKPFATLERARDAVRDLLRNGKAPKQGLTVWLRGGDYMRTQSLEFGTADSGSAGNPVVWSAYKGERVRLLGGRTLSGFHAVTDAKVLSRLSPEARQHVVQLDVREIVGRDPASLTSRGFGRAITPSHSELFFAHRPMTLARWPNEGSWEKIAGFPTGSGKGDDHGGKIGDLPEGFLYAGDRPRQWQDTSDLWVHGFWAWDWANSYEKVSELQLDKRFVKTAPPHGLYGFRIGQRFYFLNVLEELDQPGEWFLDSKTARLYFWPPSALEKGEALLSTLGEPVLAFKNASHITIHGLVLEATRGNGVDIQNGEHVRIEACSLRNLGNQAVAIRGGRNHGVAGCDIFDTGDGGVSLEGGDRQTLTPAGHFVEDCHFQHQARWSKCYAPAVLMTGVGLRASYNHIHDHPHCAILYTGNDHIIDHNDIHHIALETGDVGAIYAGRDYSYRGNQILNNYIHETGGVGMGSMGVYMDDCVSGTTVASNVFFKVHWAMFIGGGRDHRVENNLFVECDPAVRADGRGLDRSPVWRSMVNEYMRNQLAAVPTGLYRDRYPAIKSLDAYYGAPGGPVIQGDAFVGVPPEGNVIRRNVAVGKWLEVGWHAKADQFDITQNFTTNAVPNSPTAANNYVVPKAWPVWQLGYKAIPFEQIGPRRTGLRRSLPNPL